MDFSANIVCEKCEYRKKVEGFKFCSQCKASEKRRVEGEKAKAVLKAARELKQNNRIEFYAAAREAKVLSTAKSVSAESEMIKAARAQLGDAMDIFLRTAGVAPMPKVRVDVPVPARDVPADADVPARDSSADVRDAPASSSVRGSGHISPKRSHDDSSDDNQDDLERKRSKSSSSESENEADPEILLEKVRDDFEASRKKRKEIMKLAKSMKADEKKLEQEASSLQLQLRELTLQSLPPPPTSHIDTDVDLPVIFKTNITPAPMDKDMDWFIPSV